MVARLSQLGFSPFASPSPMGALGGLSALGGAPAARALPTFGFGGTDSFSRGAAAFPGSTMFGALQGSTASGAGLDPAMLQLAGALLTALAPQLAQLLAGVGAGQARSAGALSGNDWSGNARRTSWPGAGAARETRSPGAAAPAEPTAPRQVASAADEPTRADRPTNVAPGDGSARQVNVPWISQFDRRVPGAGSNACYRATATMARQVGVNVPASTEDRIQVATGESANGRVRTTPERTQAARDYIDSELARGRPAVVGVSHKQGNVNRDGITDHFVLVTGRGTDAQGRTFYTYHDPATTNRSVGDNPTRNRLYVDPQSGNLVRPGANANGYVVDRRYEMSMVVRTR